MAEISQMLRELRKYHGKTLAQVAESSGLSISYLSDIERGAAIPFDAALTMLNKILACYGLRAETKLSPLDSRIDRKPDAENPDS
jgi:transcriptional regulator with XRE-family HTH domain